MTNENELISVNRITVDYKPIGKLKKKKNNRRRNIFRVIKTEQVNISMKIFISIQDNRKVRFN